MLRIRLLSRVAVAAVVFAAACDSSSAPPPAAEGSWGGVEASLTLATTGGTIVFPCGSGVVQSGWTLSSDGNFSAMGTFTFEAGAVPPGGFVAHPARYSGKISGSTFTFNVAVTDLQQLLGPFRMTRGGPPVTSRCL